MTIPPPPSAPDPVGWLNNQPYLLLSLTSLFWAGNIVLARYVAGHVPPMTLSCIRWVGVFLCCCRSRGGISGATGPRYARDLRFWWCCRRPDLPSTMRYRTGRCNIPRR